MAGKKSNIKKPAEAREYEPALKSTREMIVSVPDKTQPEKVKQWVNMSDNTGIVAIIVLLLMIFTAAYMQMPKLEDAKVEFKEDPLNKNKNFALLAGESYKYEYTIGNLSVNTTYKVTPGNGCTIISTKVENNMTYLCLNSQGNDINGSNATYGEPDLLIFKPWMLALSENWTWKVNISANMGDRSTQLLEVNYRVVRVEQYKGRKTYVVILDNSDSSQITAMWIDDEKRILLKMSGAGYNIELKEGLLLTNS